MAKSKKTPLPKCSKAAILNKLLIDSAWAGRLVDVQKWIEQGADVNSKKVSQCDHSSTMTPIVAILFGKREYDKNNENKDFQDSSITG